MRLWQTETMSFKPGTGRRNPLKTTTVGAHCGRCEKSFEIDCEQTALVEGLGTYVVECPWCLDWASRALPGPVHSVRRPDSP